MAGFFITFEGGEGAGKTTQINRLAESLTKAGHKVLTTREPGGTPEAEKIRDLVVQRDGGNWPPLAETLLFFAARVTLVEKVIRPALDDGKIVICDRFTDSTLAYQGYGHNQDLATLKSLQDTILGDFEPDLTFVLDIDPALGLERSDRRLAAEALSIKQKEDKFESLGLAFHERLRNGFLDIAKENSKRCSIIDAAQDVDAMGDEILKISQERLAA